MLNGPSNFDQISNNLKYLNVTCGKNKANQLNKLQTFDPKHLLLSTDSLEKLSLDLLTTDIVDGILKNSKTLKVLNLSQGYKVKLVYLELNYFCHFVIGFCVRKGPIIYILP